MESPTATSGAVVGHRRQVTKGVELRQELGRESAEQLDVEDAWHAKLEQEGWQQVRRSVVATGGRRRTLTERERDFAQRVLGDGRLAERQEALLEEFDRTMRQWREQVQTPNPAIAAAELGGPAAEAAAHKHADIGSLKGLLTGCLHTCVRVCLEDFDVERVNNTISAYKDRIAKLKQERVEAHRAFMKEITSLRGQLQRLAMKRTQQPDVDIDVDEIIFYDPTAFLEESDRQFVKEIVAYKMRESSVMQVNRGEPTGSRNSWAAELQKRDQLIEELQEQIRDLEFELAGKDAKDGKGSKGMPAHLGRPRRLERLEPKKAEGAAGETRPESRPGSGSWVCPRCAWPGQEDVARVYNMGDHRRTLGSLKDDGCQPFRPSSRASALAVPCGRSRKSSECGTESARVQGEQRLGSGQGAARPSRKRQHAGSEEVGSAGGGAGQREPHGEKSQPWLVAAPQAKARERGQAPRLEPAASSGEKLPRRLSASGAAGAATAGIAEGTVGAAGTASAASAAAGAASAAGTGTSTSGTAGAGGANVGAGDAGGESATAGARGSAGGANGGAGGADGVGDGAGKAGIRASGGAGGGAGGAGDGAGKAGIRAGGGAGGGAGGAGDVAGKAGVRAGGGAGGGAGRAGDGAGKAGVRSGSAGSDAGAGGAGGAAGAVGAGGIAGAGAGAGMQPERAQAQARSAKQVTAGGAELGGTGELSRPPKLQTSSDSPGKKGLLNKSCEEEPSHGGAPTGEYNMAENELLYSSNALYFSEDSAFYNSETTFCDQASEPEPEIEAELQAHAPADSHHHDLLWKFQELQRILRAAGLGTALDTALAAISLAPMPPRLDLAAAQGYRRHSGGRNLKDAATDACLDRSFSHVCPHCGKSSEVLPPDSPSAEVGEDPLASPSEERSWHGTRRRMAGGTLTRTSQRLSRHDLWPRSSKVEDCGELEAAARMSTSGRQLLRHRELPKVPLIRQDASNWYGAGAAELYRRAVLQEGEGRQSGRWEAKLLEQPGRYVGYDGSVLRCDLALDSAGASPSEAKRASLRETSSGSLVTSGGEPNSGPMEQLVRYVGYDAAAEATAEMDGGGRLSMERSPRLSQEHRWRPLIRRSAICLAACGGSIEDPHYHPSAPVLPPRTNARSKVGAERWPSVSDKQPTHGVPEEVWAQRWSKSYSVMGLPPLLVHTSASGQLLTSNAGAMFSPATTSPTLRPSASVPARLGPEKDLFPSVAQKPVTGERLTPLRAAGPT